MAKKKKPSLKPAANRGFATTSTPSKKPEPAAAPEGEEAPQTEKDASTEPPSDGQHASKEASPQDAQTKQDHLPDFEQDSEEMEMQLLIDRLGDRPEREVSRLWKVGGTR